MEVDGETAGVFGASPDALTRRQRLWAGLATGLVWICGSGIVAIAQSGSDRRLSAIGGAAAGILVILVVSRLTADPARRYFRSVVGAILAVSVVSEWLVWHLISNVSGFEVDGIVKRVTLPLLVVLLAPLATTALWTQRSALIRSVRGMDWIVGAYATIVLLPALAVGLHHHNRLLYVAQDLGLIVFFVFMYVVGRAVSPGTARSSAGELTDTLLLLAVVQWLLFRWNLFPLYSYFEAASAAALAFVLLRPRDSRLLAAGLAVALLTFDAVQIKEGTNSSTAVELAGALGVLVYLAVRTRRLVPQWLVIALALLAFTGFLGLTRDGTALRGQYHGADVSNLGTTYEAHRVRAAVDTSPLAFALGRGLGGTIDETHAPPGFRETLIYGGRDLAHVQEVHLLGYSFLLKAGLLGLAWLAAFIAGLVILVCRALERSARERDPGLVIYAALPLLGIVQAFAASSRVQANPLNGLALGILVSYLGGRPALGASIRAHRKQILAAGLCTLAGCAAIGYVSAHRTFATEPVAAPQPIALWIGDSYTAGAGATTSATGEALATSAALGWQTDMDAQGSTGFVARGRRGGHPPNRPVPERIAADASSFLGVDVVLVDAGRNDVGHSQAKLHRAVVSSFRAIAKGFPFSAVVVIAPYLMTSKRDDFLAIRHLLRRQAKIHGWAFVDPIAEGWINRASAKLTVRDHIHPNQEGYDYIVAHLAPAITKALRAAHEHVSLQCTRAAPCRRPARARTR